MNNCKTCRFFDDNAYLKCAVNPLFPWNSLSSCKFYEQGEKIKQLNTLANFKVFSLLNGKYRFEIRITDINSNYLEHWWDKRIFNSQQEVFELIKKLIPFSPLWYADYAFLIVEWRDIFYKDWLIIAQESPEIPEIIDPKTNQIFQLKELGLKLPIPCFVGDKINLIKDWIDFFESERERLYVPGQLSLF